MSRRFYPNIIHLSGKWMQMLNENGVRLPDGKIVPARALGWGGFTNRVRASWLVWTGRADALVWPGNQ